MDASESRRGRQKLENDEIGRKTFSVPTPSHLHKDKMLRSGHPMFEMESNPHNLFSYQHDRLGVIVVGNSRYLFNRSDVTLRYVEIEDVLQTHVEEDTVLTYPSPVYKVKKIPPSSYVQLPGQTLEGMQSWRIVRAEWRDGRKENDSTHLAEHKIWSLVNFDERQVDCRVRRKSGQQRLERRWRDTKHIKLLVEGGALYIVNQGSVPIDELQVKRFYCREDQSADNDSAESTGTSTRRPTTIFRIRDLPGSSLTTLEHGLDSEQAKVQIYLQRVEWANGEWFEGAEKINELHPDAPQEYIAAREVGSRSERVDEKK